MPLLDHFHPPVSQRRSWEGFYVLWAAALVEKLNEDILAEEYFAEMHVHVDGQVEVDVSPVDESLNTTQGASVVTTTSPAPAWAPTKTSLIFPTVFPDDIEVQVFSSTPWAILMAAIELVSDGNKDRPETRQAFAAKCVSYLTRGIGLIVVDIVTNRLANLHNEIMGLFGRGEPFVMTQAAATYAVAYRPSRQPSGDQIEFWPTPLTLGQPLPVLPLALRNAGVVPVDLETTYTEACQRSRLT